MEARVSLSYVDTVWGDLNQGNDQAFAEDLEAFKSHPSVCQFYSLALALESTTKIEVYARQLYQIADKQRLFRTSEEGLTSKEWYLKFCKDHGVEIHPQTSLAKKVLGLVLCSRKP